jgi:hypothetical protein
MAKMKDYQQFKFTILKKDKRNFEKYPENKTFENKFRSTCKSQVFLLLCLNLFAPI